MHTSNSHADPKGEDSSDGEELLDFAKPVSHQLETTTRSWKKLENRTLTVVDHAADVYNGTLRACADGEEGEDKAEMFQRHGKTRMMRLVVVRFRRLSRTLKRCRNRFDSVVNSPDPKNEYADLYIVSSLLDINLC